MLDIYFVPETGQWIVTYQHNAHSSIQTLYEGPSAGQAYKTYWAFIEEWDGPLAEVKMELKKTEYVIGAETLRKVLEVLGDHWFSPGEDDEYSNDDIIEADLALQEEIKTQEEHNE